MIRRLLSLVLLLGVYLLLTVFALEVGLRVFQRVPPAEPPGFFWRAPDPITGWSLTPGVTARWHNPMYEFDVNVSINELGLRSPATIGYEKPEGVYRIVLLGDSFVEALQVPLEQSFGQQIAQMLNLAGAQNDGSTVQVEVINAGVSGWGTDQQLLWLRHEGYKYDPDLVLVAFFPTNDFMNNYMPLEFANLPAVRKPWFELVDGQLHLNNFPFDPSTTRESRRRLRALTGATTTAADEEDTAPQGESTPPLAAAGEWLHQYSALHRFLDPRLRVAAPALSAWLAQLGIFKPGQESSDLAQGPAYIPVAYGIYATPLPEPWQQATQTTAAILKELAQEADALGAPVRGVLLPSFEEVDAAQWTQILQRYPAMQSQQWDTTQPARLAAQVFAEAGIPLLDTAPALRQQLEQEQRLYLRDDRHFTPQGHAATAQTLATWLTRDPTAGVLSVQQPIPEPGRAWGHLIWRIFVWSIIAVLVFSLVWSIYKNGVRIWLRNVRLNLGTAAELLAFLVVRENFVLLPLVVVLLVFGGLLIIAQASVVGPFIYTLF